MINPRTIAQEIAYADVATQAANLQEKQSELDAESSGLDSLSSAVSAFQRPFPPIPRRRREATHFSLSNWHRGSKPRSVWATTPFPLPAPSN